MSLPIEKRRVPLYFHAPSRSDLPNPDRYDFLTNSLYQQLFLNPFLSETRQLFGSILGELYHRPNLAYESGYSSSDVLLSIAVLQNLLTTFGLASGDEILGLHEHSGHNFNEINPKDKFATLASLREHTARLHAEGKKIALVHGSFDPAHAGHARLFSQVWPYCDTVIVGIDSDELLKTRKGDDRPRVPLGARLWQIASLPSVDNIFVLPYTSTPEATEFGRLYESLHIDVLGCGGDNVLKEEFTKRMESIGGIVISDDAEPFSSTRMVADLQDEKISKNTLMRMEDIRLRAQVYDQLARQAWNLRS